MEYSLKLRYTHAWTLLSVLSMCSGNTGDMEKETKLLLNDEEQRRNSAYRSFLVHLCQVVMVSAADLAVVCVH